MIFCGELLQQASSLIAQGLPISDIIAGYNKALDKTLEFLDGKSDRSVNVMKILKIFFFLFLLFRIIY